MRPLFNYTGSLMYGVIFLSVLILVLSLMLNLSGEKTIRAGEIKINYKTFIQPPEPLPISIEGSFTIDTPVLKHATIPSQGTGGACLVADLNAYGKPDMSGTTGLCSVNSDCKSGLPADWVGYCGPEKRCWVRPGKQADLCNISKFYPILKIWEDGIRNPTPRMPYLVTLFAHSGDLVRVKWRVVACLNMKKQNGVDVSIPTEGGCASQDGTMRMEVFGKPADGYY